MPNILGVDLGGTKAHVVAADHLGHILGFGDDKGWSETVPDRRIRKMRRILFASQKAAAQAGLALPDFERVSASCSGADWKFEYPIGIRHLRETLGIPMVSYYNDCIGALRGGTEMIGRDCAVICLGTGANCAVYSREGEDYQYAYYLKDIHQGGGAIGRFIVEAVVDASVGLAPETALTRLLLEATGLGSVEELHMLFTTGRAEDEPPSPPHYKEFCPLLFEAIRLGDQVALSYIDQYCAGLAKYVIVAARRLSMEKRDITVVISGGVCKEDNVVSALVEKHLREALPGTRCVDACFEPVVGALLLEYDRIYPGGVPESVMGELERSCAQYGLFRRSRENGPQFKVQFKGERASC
jgi:N-acetylglucosamine kinase-like BadF-type ATPase